MAEGHPPQAVEGILAEGMAATAAVTTWALEVRCQSNSPCKLSSASSHLPARSSALVFLL